MLVDTHCHLQHQEFDSDRDEVIKRAFRMGVRKIIVPGLELKSSKKAIELAHTHRGQIFTAVGFHPYAAVKINDPIAIISQLEGLVYEKGVVAIGEIGLDYFRFKSNEFKHRQREFFRQQLTLAAKVHLPVIIHCRDAWDDLLDILAEFKPKGVVHCFSGGKIHLREVLKLGLYVGVDGNITYDKTLPEIIREAPLERILLETDAPYLTPVPYRGQRNTPQNVKIVAEELAKLFSQSVQKVREMTTRNATDLFDI